MYMYNEKAKQQERITQEKLRSKTMAIKKKKKKGKARQVDGIHSTQATNIWEIAMEWQPDDGQ